MENTSNEKITEALKLLEEAAKLKKAELKTVFTDKYTNLRNLIVESESNLLNSLNTAKDLALEKAAKVKEAGIEKTREISQEVDKHVHQNPWHFIAGTAVAGLLLGYILGRRK